MTISHVELNKPLTGTDQEKAVELYNLRRENLALRESLGLGDDRPTLDQVDTLVNSITNKHRHTNGFLLTPDDLADIIHFLRKRQN